MFLLMSFFDIVLYKISSLITMKGYFYSVPLQNDNNIPLMTAYKYYWNWNNIRGLSHATIQLNNKKSYLKEGTDNKIKRH